MWTLMMKVQRALIKRVLMERALIKKAQKERAQKERAQKERVGGMLWRMTLMIEKSRIQKIPGTTFPKDKYRHAMF